MLLRLALAVVIAIACVTPRMTTAAGQPSAVGVLIARMVNTAQADQKNGYAPLNELVNDAAFARLGGALVVDGDEGVIGQHRVTLTLNSDKRRYQLAIVPTDGCGPAWFSSERGLIYTGQALGC